MSVARAVSAAKLRGRRLKLLREGGEGGRRNAAVTRASLSSFLTDGPTERATPILSTDDVKSADGSAHAAATSNGDSFSDFCLKIEARNLEVESLCARAST